ncbi:MULTISPECIES: glycine--tRNA ligase subunit beta [unclassified Nitratiruptor]|uniref:glycine--tRNA ligase subunit beta n=1 Tax=unclassified Nitratiruptor TaxID=2624044 RepID=UPI00193542FA|nr:MULTISPECIES: glycine--tRNA ligase subunit beta [unclassified Nitratiruptor]BCD60542.1 glycyl-tRNA synthetase beta chain [Nitratiruptor sp. YY08-10]BCD63969.1 glycyl-tRNA synthetase beta chain [Nitratiruptor sp. YY08-14]
MTEPLLIEIGVEELPAIPFLKELPNIEKKWEKILEANGLLCEFEFFYTPRRLVLWHRNFKTKQDTTYQEFFGAPLHIAFKDGQPTLAATGFARKCGVRVEELSTTKRGSTEILYYKKEIAGKPSVEILPGMVYEWLKSLDFGKSMRWGNLKDSFIRPIRWGIINLGESFIKAELFGITTANYTYLHRSVSTEPVQVANAKEYFEKLKNGGVLLFPEARYEKIDAEFANIEKEGVVIEKDENLLAEVVAITEFPTALKGSFEEKFLQLPPEVIVTSMKEHQRYFPVYKEGKLQNGFVFVSNAYTDDFSLIVKGNERVLKARLSDALFFWENDLKKGLNFEELENVVFMDGLGTLFDKEVRELKIANHLLEHYNALFSEPGVTKALLERAIMLSYADLLTEMVYEFTELQGIMGYYYALAQGEDEVVALAIKEQYLPSGEESELPSTLFSAIVALSKKLDTLMALFSVGKIPTGSRDPFGLRRAANGVIRIVLAYNLDFDISKIFDEIKSEYKDFDTKKLENFFIERINQFYDVNPSVIKAVIESGERDLVQIDKKIKALAAIVESSDFKDIFTTFKRVANIVKDVDVSKETPVDENLFESDYEKRLWDRFQEVYEKSYPDYESRLDALFGLKHDIDLFFDNVLVNAEDERLRQNRKNLIASIYKAFKEIADIKEISV